MSSRADATFARYQKLGTPSLLGEVYDETAPKLFGLALQLTRDHALAEDLIHSTYLRAIEEQHNWDPAQPLLQWLSDILGECFFRTPKGYAVLPDGEMEPLAPERSSPLSRAQAAELDKHLDEALVKIPQPYRAVLELRIKNGLDSREIGRRLHRAPGTVRSQLARGLERLRGLLPLLIAHWLISDASPWTPLPGADLRTQVLEKSIPVPNHAGGSVAQSKQGAKIVTQVGGFHTAAYVGALLLALTFVGIWLFGKQSERDAHGEINIARVEPNREQGNLRIHEPKPRLTIGSADPGDEPPALPMATVLGRVLDQTGQPIAGADVSIFSWRAWRADFLAPPLENSGRKAGWATKTDAKGQYQFEVPVPGSHQPAVEIRAGENYTVDMIWCGNTDGGAWPIRQGKNVLPTASLVHGGGAEGVALDADGQPLPYAQITLLPGQQLNVGTMLSTDAQGRFAVSHLLPGYHHVTLTKETLSKNQAPLFVRPGERLTNQTFTLPAKRAVDITVLNPEGNPVEEAIVSVQIQNLNPPTWVAPLSKTDSEGSIRLEFAHTDRVQVIARKPGLFTCSTVIDVSSVDGPVVLTFPARQPIAFQIIEASTGSDLPPESQAKIKLKQPRDPKRPNQIPVSASFKTRAEANGKFLFPAQKGDTYLVQVPGFRAATGVIEDLSTTPVVTLHKHRPIQGRVVHKGVPVPNASVELIFRNSPNASPSDPVSSLSSVKRLLPAKSSAALKRTETRADGTFLFDDAIAHNAVIRVSVVHPDLGTAQVLRELQPEDPSSCSLGDLSLSDHCELRGKVLLPEGLSIANLTISLNSESSAFQTSLASDNSFVLKGLPTGQHRIRIPTTVQLHGAAFDHPIELAPGTPLEVELDLRPFVRLSHHLQVNDALGEPLADYKIALVPKGYAGSTPPEGTLLGHTNIEGSVVGRCLGSGTLHVMWQKKGQAKWTLERSLAIEANPGPGRRFSHEINLR